MWPFDNTNPQIYQEYAQAYDSGNYSRFEPHQALSHLQQFMRAAPIDMQQRIYQQHFEQMPYEQRTMLVERVPPEYGMDANNPWSMSQSFLRMGQEQPQLFHSIFSHPTMLGGALALTGLVAKHMLSSHQQGEYMYQQSGYPRGAYQQEERLQRELNHEHREERELRRELRQEERRIEELEEDEPRRRHRREY
ncbi:MAG: hypothetical protein PVS3B1_15670 [Ktedonobacteraceae bacterium]